MLAQRASLVVTRGILADVEELGPWVSAWDASPSAAATQVVALPPTDLNAPPPPGSRLPATDVEQRIEELERTLRMQQSQVDSLQRQLTMATGPQAYDPPNSYTDGSQLQMQGACCDPSSVCDDCDCPADLPDCCDCFNDRKRIFGMLPSDHCFDRFISPLSNPFFFEDPRSLTEARGIFIDNALPGSIGGGDLQLWAAQFRGRLTDRWSVIAPRLSYLQINQAGGGNPQGFLSAPVGVKFNFLRDVDHQFLVSGASPTLSQGRRARLPTSAAATSTSSLPPARRSSSGATG